MRFFIKYSYDAEPDSPYNQRRVHKNETIDLDLRADIPTQVEEYCFPKYGPYPENFSVDFMIQVGD